MQLTHLSLTQFRNFARLDTDVPGDTVILVGKNAQGKTTILEAIYYLATLSSFHTESDRELVNFIEGRKPLAVARIQAEYTKKGGKHRLEIRIIKESTRNGVERSRKEVLLDGVKKKSSEVVGHFNAVMFLPRMMQIIEGSPGDRRRFLDLLISQVSPIYAENLRDYTKVLTQRNALLRSLNERGGDPGQLGFWNERLAARGAQIIRDRITALQELETVAKRVHHELTQTNEVLRLAYYPAYDPLPAPEGQMQLLEAETDRTKFDFEKIKSGFLAALDKIRQEEIYRGQTTIGPHRDEIRFLSNQIDLGTYGSRGQVRTAMMTMKLAEVAWMKEKTGEWPVLLLDEVLAELDEERRANLLARIQNGQQALLTTTDLNLFKPEFVEGAQIWEIDNGRLGKKEE